MNNHADLDFQQNEDIFRTLIEKSPIPIGLYIGADMLIKIANKALLKVFGKGDDVIGKFYFDVLPELKEQDIFKILNNVYSTGIAYEATGDKVDLFVDGKLQEFYFNFTFKPLKNTEGKVWGVLNTAADVTELVLTKKELAESEERTNFALKSAGLGTWTLNPLTENVIWDERCKELFGFGCDESVMYKDVLNYIYPDDKYYVIEQVSQAIDPNVRKTYDVTYRTMGTENQGIRWIKAKGRAYFNDHNLCTSFAGTVQDITREIADNEELLKLIALVENTADIICVADLDANITYLNKAGQILFGADNQQEALKPWVDYFVSEDSSKVQGEFLPALLKTGKWEGELHYKHFKTGATIPVYLNAFRINDPINGSPKALACIARDLRAEKEARVEQNKLIALIDHSSDFISLSDINANVTYVNKAGRNIIGLDNYDDIFLHNSEYVMPDELDKLKNDINKTLETTGRWAGEINYRHFKTGEPIPVSLTSMMVSDPLTGMALGRASIARDMRREIADKKALIESEHLLQNITTAAPIALWMADENGDITYVNQTWIDWTGYSFQDNLGTGWTKAILPDDRQRAINHFMTDLNARKPYEISFRLLADGQEIRWCVATGNPQYSGDGSFAGYIGACTDVTEKTLAEQQLYLKNEELNDQIKQFEFVTGFMPVQLWTATITGELDYVNQRTLDFFGAAAEDIVGPQWILRVHPDDRDACIATWTRSLQTGDVYQFEFRLKDKNGNDKWHLARALPFISDGKIVKWFGTNTDIDDQKQLQRQKDDFLGIASHELKTPVTSIKAYAQVLGAMLAKEGEQKKAEMVLRMDAQVNRLTNLIGDLLDVTKINSGRLQFNKTWFNFNHTINETIEDLQHTTKKHQLIKEFTETGDIYSDKDRIGQVITNLITNAIKYSPLSDQIIITTKLDNNEIILCVQDFGIGIPADKTERVFEQFYRVSGNKQHTFPGLGLGLYISSEIIKREGGRMWVNSIEGKGSTFCFALPVNNLDQEANNN